MKFIHLFRCNSPYVASKQVWRIMNLAFGKLNEANKNKWLMRIKLIIVIMTTFLVQVSASGFAQRVTLKESNISLKAVFAQIRKQTGYSVLYETRLIRETRPVNVNVEEMPLAEALKEILSGQGLDYEIKTRTIIVTAKEPSFLERLVDAFTPPVDISGTVYDEKGIRCRG